jgi:hypothetical protein
MENPSTSFRWLAVNVTSRLRSDDYSSKDITYCYAQECPIVMNPPQYQKVVVSVLVLPTTDSEKSFK